ncbi:MAG: hypothetical protein HY377_01835 [Candidatus Blackburnbacteria bacterium]|nr:hypothetical protein [Candidatus Blackburnbacteria bacterium]
MIGDIGANSLVWLLAKILVLVGLGVYLVFAGVVMKQVQLMVGTIEAPFDRFLPALALIHMLFAIGVFILALVVL